MWVQVNFLAFLAAIAAALPREHGAAVAGRFGGAPRFRQPPVAIAQKRPGERRQAQVEEREDEQLVPQDMAAVRLAVPAARRHADVEIDRVAGDGLQQMEDVQTKDRHDSGVGGGVELEVALFPKLAPGEAMTGEQLVEAPERARLLARFQGGLGGRGIARAV
jgi:hypothetical protein